MVNGWPLVALVNLKPLQQQQRFIVGSIILWGIRCKPQMGMRVIQMSMRRIKAPLFPCLYIKKKSSVVRLLVRIHWWYEASRLTAWCDFLPASSILHRLFSFPPGDGKATTTKMTHTQKRLFFVLLLSCHPNQSVLRLALLCNCPPPPPHKTDDCMLTGDHRCPPAAEAETVAALGRKLTWCSRSIITPQLILSRSAPHQEVPADECWMSEEESH